MTYANSADPDQTLLVRVFIVYLSTKYFKKQLHRKQNLEEKKKNWIKSSKF